MPIGAAASNPRKFYNRRALLGVLLMVVAVALVLLAIRLAAQMDTYYVAKKPLVVGQSVGPQDLGTIQANPGNAAGKYLSTHTPLSKDLVATQNIDTGELVPKSALMETVPDMKSVVVELCAPLPKRVKAGDYLELWQRGLEMTFTTCHHTVTGAVARVGKDFVDVADHGRNIAIPFPALLYVACPRH